jgi:hypothetical protein
MAIDLLFGAFGLFACCCILQLWLLKRVQGRLTRRHPRTFPAVEKRSFLFPTRAIWFFTVNDAYKRLDDAKLNRRVRDLKLGGVAAMISWFAFVILGFMGFEGY